MQQVQEYTKGIIPKVKAIHSKTRGSYGARRMSKELQAEGEQCGRAKATILMTLAGVEAKQKKKYKVTTNSKHNLPVAPNLLERNFEVSEPDRVYCADITYIWTTEGWLYLAIILDLFSRRVVGWSVGDRMKKELVMKALEMAIGRRRPAPDLLFH
ncbi:MAG: putative transposase [Desulforhopalus sp.]